MKKYLLCSLLLLTHYVTPHWAEVAREQERQDRCCRVVLGTTLMLLLVGTAVTVNVVEPPARNATGIVRQRRSN